MKILCCISGHWSTSAGTLGVCKISGRNRHRQLTHLYHSRPGRIRNILIEEVETSSRFFTFLKLAKI